jgi:hypothetical protein
MEQLAYLVTQEQNGEQRDQVAVPLALVVASLWQEKTADFMEEVVVEPIRVQANAAVAERRVS